MLLIQLRCSKPIIPRSDDREDESEDRDESESQTSRLIVGLVALRTAVRRARAFD